MLYTWMGTKYVGTVMAVRASEEGHVLHHAQDGNIHLLEHVDTLHGIFQGNILRCGDDDSPYRN